MPQLSPSTRCVLAHSSTGGTSPCRRHRVMVLGSNPGHGVYVYVRTGTNWYELVRTGTNWYILAVVLALAKVGY